MWLVCDSKMSTLPATVRERGVAIFGNVSSMQDDSDAKHGSSVSSYNPLSVLCKFNPEMPSLQPVNHWGNSFFWDSHYTNDTCTNIRFDNSTNLLTY